MFHTPPRRLAVLTAAALLAAACADPASAPRSLTAGRASGDNVASLPGQPAGTDASVTIASSGDTHWCGTAVGNVAPTVATFAGTDCVTNAVDLTTPLSSYNPGWSAAFAGSSWIGPAVANGTSQEYRTLPGTYEFIQAFTVPAGATNISLQLSVKSDNALKVYLNGTAIGGNAVISDCLSPPACNWNIALNMNNSPATFNTGATPNILRVDLVDTRIGFDPANPGVDNCAKGPQVAPPAAGDFDAPYNAAACPNPAGVDFSGTVYYKAAPKAIALFVIGDVEAHALGDVVNFWGAQWWKNNDMSGTVSPGVASFKGYATSSDNVCGGNWISLPGNSSNPPDQIPDDVAIIVTSKVIKNGPNISGDIKQIVLVHHDGKYGPNPGHRGGGPVTQVLCP